MGILRTRMEQDLVLRGRSEHTRRAYLRAVADLARSDHRSPDQLSDREVHGESPLNADCPPPSPRTLSHPAGRSAG